MINNNRNKKTDLKKLSRMVVTFRGRELIVSAGDNLEAGNILGLNLFSL